MNYKKNFIIIFTAIIFLFFFTYSSSVFSENTSKIFINGQNNTQNLEPLKSNGAVLVRSKALADSIGAELDWLGSINTLSITQDEKTVKMMVGSPYIQINNTAIKTESPMVIKDGYTYIPFKDIMNVFGFLIEYDRIDDAYYLFKPQSHLKEVMWGPNRQSMILMMDNIAPYRIKLTDDPKKLIVEIEKAAVSPKFLDKVSNKNYYLSTKRIENKATLQISLTSKYPIPINSDEVISEQNGNLIIQFMPQITAINWKENGTLEIQANGDVTKPEVSFLENPRRMVLDIPDLLLSEFEKNIKDNEWIKNVRVSQFQFEPMVLRVVLDLKEDKYLNIVNKEKTDTIVLKPAHRAKISDLNYENHQIIFKTDASIEPDFFTLTDPERLVINLFNTYRDENILDEINIEKNIVNRIRVGRFDSQIVRIVADLNEMTSYRWEQEQYSKGTYIHRISFANKFDNIELLDQNMYTNININVSGEVNYKVRKFSYPHRIVVDISGKEITPNEIELPDPVGIVKEMRMSRFELDNETVTRVVFELSDYYNHNILSDNPDSNINIALAKSKIQGENNIIVLDAGHGGFDPGAVGSNLQEKDVNFKIVKRLESILKSHGFKVLLTRDDDTFISLSQRVQFANNNNARLFISIHNNSSNKNTSEGTETFISPNKTGDSYLLANSIQNQLVNGLELVNRGVKKENLYVIKYTKMPAVLVEVAFLSNPNEEKLLRDEKFITKTAVSISRGIFDYLDKFKD
ncbi:MAG: N-acetylmuramoyl-L-alanine amidase family protein [Halanaerobiales bacterium]|nr:N-acetylmuramoyl-L-alanine amidase family protein [Halanaerobiales bacterium]